jgi:hypothetical protein
MLDVIAIATYAATFGFASERRRGADAPTRGTMPMALTLRGASPHDEARPDLNATAHDPNHRLTPVHRRH